MKQMLRRILAALPAVLLQVLWLLLLLSWLAPWAALIGLVLSVLSLFFVLYIVTKRDEGTYKILWLLVILVFPVLGAVLYLLFGNKRTTRPLRRKLRAAPPLPPWPEGDAGNPPLPAEDRRMAATLDYIHGLTGYPLCVNRGARYFPLGDDLFPSMLEAIRGAQRYIFVEYFIIDRGLMWDSMVELMAEKAAQGVDVRVMYDDLGSLSTYSRKNVRELQRRGIRCLCFNPLVFIKGTLSYRDHRKMLIIDGKTAFSGGINLADEYINRVEKYGHWKDIGFRLTGEGVYSYVRMFAQFWNAFSRDPIPDALLAPPERGGAEGPADGYVLSYCDSPLSSHAVSNELLIELLSQAVDYAWFFSPYLMPGDALMGAMTRAARRGVDVRVFMPGVPDKRLVFRMSHSFYPMLLEAGVKIYEYTPGFLHAKACLIDGRVGTVGTVNLDYRSLFLHFENNSLFFRASLLEDLRQDFLATQAQCRQMELGKNVKTGLWNWTLDGVLRILAPLC